MNSFPPGTRYNYKKLFFVGDIHHTGTDTDSQEVQRDPHHTKSGVGFHRIHITVEGR
jgi:hypothetical protein